MKFSLEIFIQSKKVCKVCISAIITALSDQQATIKYSQHNTQANKTFSVFIDYHSTQKSEFENIFIT